MTTGSVRVAWRDGWLADWIGKAVLLALTLNTGAEGKLVCRKKVAEAEAIGKAVLVALKLYTGFEGRFVCAKDVDEAEAGPEGVASAMEEVANGADGPPSMLSLDASPSYTFSEFTAQ